jgi:glutathione S-transferase
VCIALLEKKLPHEKHVVDLQDKPEDFVALYRTAISDPNGRGVVPMIECDDGSTVLAESMVLLDYLDDLHPPSLTLEQRARARLFATLFPGRLSSFGILKCEPGSSEEAAAVEKLRADLKAMDNFLAETGPGPFLYGEEFSCAEAAAAPFAQRLIHVLPGVRPELDPKAWMANDGLGRLAGWMQAVCERESCVESLPPPAELVESFSKMVERMKAAAA